MERNFGQVWTKRIGPSKNPGTVNGPETLALIDTGCDQMFLREQIGETAGKLAKEEVAPKCIHGNILWYPSMIVKLTVDRSQGHIKVYMFPDYPYPVILA